MNSYAGGCHCGALGFEYRTGIAPGEWSLRACQCTFCVARGAVYTSDAGGSLRWTHSEPARLTRYRFGHKTADFVFCARCGGYLGAVTVEDGRELVVINVNAMRPRPEGLGSSKPVSYDGESSEGRGARRAERWTPVSG